MALLILFAFIALPIVEIAIFIQVGDEIGLAATLATTVLTAVIGTLLVRTQGLATVRKVQASLAEGGIPLRPAFDGACQLIAGALLLTPGFLTDAIGLLLFIPPLRMLLLAWIISRAGGNIVVRRSGFNPGQPESPEHPRQNYDVDGDYTDVTPSDAPPLPPAKDDQNR